MSSRPAWFDALTNPATYPHPVSKIGIIETHISWAVLTGEAVYKLKKPVDLGFANFTTLELRKAACDDELRLNRRTAPTLYERVVPLTHDAKGPRFDGQGDILDYAVRMRQFDQDDLLLNRIKKSGLSESVIDQLGIEIANLHRSAAIAPLSKSFGDPGLVISTVNVCLDVLKKTPSIGTIASSLSKLSQWVASEGHHLHRFFSNRKEQGWVRECHGDLHLRNLVFFENKPTLFDCIEFNEELRWIDVISDIAFLVMDLQDHGAPALSWRVLNVWLEQMGDFWGLSALHFYLVYRSLVRAKVAAIRCQQADLTEEDRNKQLTLIDDYLNLAVGYTQDQHKGFVLMHGVSGSGKSFVARQLAQEFGGIQLRSDVERKRLYGVWPPGQLEFRNTEELYSDEATRKTYDRLLLLAKTIVDAGFLAIIDASFLKREERQQLIDLAKRENIPYTIVSCSAPETVLLERIRARQQAKRDASDADARILKLQLATMEPLTHEERDMAVHHDTSLDHITGLFSQVRHRLELD